MWPVTTIPDSISIWHVINAGNPRGHLESGWWNTWSHLSLQELRYFHKHPWTKIQTLASPEPHRPLLQFTPCHPLLFLSTTLESDPMFYFQNTRRLCTPWHFYGHLHLGFPFYGIPIFFSPTYHNLCAEYYSLIFPISVSKYILQHSGIWASRSKNIVIQGCDLNSAWHNIGGGQLIFILRIN